MFTIPISTGGIDYILNKVKSKAAATYESIRQSVLKNKVIGADEIGVNINGKNNRNPLHITKLIAQCNGATE